MNNEVLRFCPPPRKALCLGFFKLFLGTIHCGSIKEKLFSAVKQHFGKVSACVAQSAGKRKAAFTLAEVLITLGIIGVVASLTIPSLIQSYKKQAATARLKKFYSTMEQAIKLSEIDNGPVEYWTKEEFALGALGSDASEDVKNEALAKDKASVKTFYQTYIKPYLRVAKEDFVDADKWIKIYFSDGSTVSMSNGGCTDFAFDINGIKSPNTNGRDIFVFLLCPSTSGNSVWGFSDNQTFRPYVERNQIANNGSISREKLLEICKSKAYYCTGLLMYDNWEFKDDYPHRL